MEEERNVLQTAHNTLLKQQEALRKTLRGDSIAIAHLLHLTSLEGLYVSFLCLDFLLQETSPRAGLTPTAVAITCPIQRRTGTIAGMTAGRKALGHVSR